MTGVPDLTPLDAEIGAIAKSYREGKKLSQEKIAEVLGLSTASVSMMERGERAWAVKYIYALAQFYAVEPASFLGGVKASPEDAKLLDAIRERLDVQKRINASSKTKS